MGTTIIGTYGYMAPEQFRGAAQPASDLYALGGTLLFLLSGACGQDAQGYCCCAAWIRHLQAPDRVKPCYSWIAPLGGPRHVAIRCPLASV